MRAAALVSVMGLLALGCDKDNGAFCDASKTCPAGQACDLTANQCVSMSGLDLSVPDSALPDDLSTIDATPICAVPCSGATPVCVAPQCVACGAVADPEGTCAALEPATPHCLLGNDAGVGGGECVECRSAADCSNAKKAICDGASHKCRACKSNNDCASGVCDQFSTAGFGECVDPGQVVNVNNSAAGCPGSSTVPNTFCTITAGIAAAKSGNKTVVNVIGTSGGPVYNENPSADFTVTIVGNLDANGLPLAVISPGNHDAFTVNGMNTTVTLYGISLSSAGNGHAGLLCGGAVGDNKTVNLIRSVIRTNDGWGIDGTNCTTLVIDASRVQQNGAGGGAGAIFVAKNATISNSFIVSNGRATGGDIGGITIKSALGDNVVLVNDTIADNIGGTAANQGVDCVGTANVTLFNDILFFNHFGITISDTNCTLVTYTASDGPEGALAASHNVALSITNLPKFVNEGTLDYHLMSGSPCINVGLATNAPDHDIDFQARPDKTSGLVDVGADEVP